MSPHPLLLTSDEVEIVREIEQPDAPPNLARPKLAVRAEMVRAVVLGLTVEFPQSDPAKPREIRKAEVTLAGWRFRRCIVTGDLNLGDAGAPDGRALPPLVMEECTFAGKIEMPRARFRSLSFAGSRITEIHAKNLKLEGPLDLSGMRSSEAAAEAAPYRSDAGERTGCKYKGRRFGRAWVELGNSQIEGAVRASKSCFVAPEPRPGFDYRIEAPQFALGLQGCTIRGSLEFNETFAMGGISASMAQVGGDVLGSGARLFGVEGSALRLDGAHIGSSIYLRPWSSGDSRVRRFQARGRVGLRGTVIADSLGMEGALLKGDKGEMAVYADRAEVGGICIFSGYVIPTRPGAGGSARHFRFEAHGGLYLGNSTFKGDLYLSGAYLRAPAEGGSAFIGTGMTVWGSTNFGVEQAETAGGTKSFPFVAKGPVALDYADLRQDLNMGGAKLYIERKLCTQAALWAEGLRVRGICRLNTVVGLRKGKSRPMRFWAASAVYLTSVDIGDTLFMHGAHVRACAGDTDKIALELFGAKIGQEASFTSFSYSADGHSFPVRFDSFGTVSLPYMTTGTALRMKGARIRRAGYKGAIYADYVEVGSYVDLGPEDRLPLESEGQIDFSHATVGTNLRLSDAQIRVDEKTRPALRIVSSKIGGALSMDDTVLIGAGQEAGRSLVSLSFSSVEGELWVRLSVQRAESEAKDGNDIFDIDLKELHVHQLNDAEGRGWGNGVRLLVDGFVCDRLPHRLTKPRQINFLSDASLERIPRILRGPVSYLLRLIVFLISWALMPAFFFLSLVFLLLRPVVGPKPRKTMWRLFRQSWQAIKVLGAALLGLKDRVAQHIAWLNLHYKDPEHPTQDEFTPSAYDALAKLLRDEGYETESKKVLAAKLTVKRKVSTPWYAMPGWWVYHRLFGYGLSPLNPFATMVTLLLFGWGAAWVADHDLPWLWHHEHVLVVTTSTVNTLAVEDPETGKELTTAVEYGGKTPGQGTGLVPVTNEIPCGKRIDPLLYAIEVFVPALDLHQTSLCEISYEANARWWRIGRAIYAILGWIVTSITVLTIPGILRRRAEE